MIEFLNFDIEINEENRNSLVIILLEIAVIENRYFVVTEQIRIFIHFACIFFVINNQFK